MIQKVEKTRFLRITWFWVWRWHAQNVRKGIYLYVEFLFLKRYELYREYSNYNYQFFYKKIKILQIEEKVMEKMEKNGLLELFEKNKHNKFKYFMPFLVAGDPDIKQFKKLALAIEPYIDILEVGIPFSDPIADGPTIQEANVRAFNVGINTK